MTVKQFNETVGNISDITDPAGRTDVANGCRMAKACKDFIRWCPPWQKFLVFDGKRWRFDAEDYVAHVAKQVAAGVWKDIGTQVMLAEGPQAKEYTAFGRATTSRRGIESMIAMVKSEKGMPIMPAKLDQHPYLFNCNNGTLDLRTGKLRPHHREDFLTKLCPTTFKSGAKCPTWDAFLDTIMAADVKQVEFLQRICGYCLTGDVSEHVLPIAYGKGSNGKSTFLNAFMDTLGLDYAMQAPDGLLMAKNNESHPTERADLFGKRFVASNEVEDGRRFNESLVKQLTGGDPIRARRMREDHWEFLPTHKLLLAVNHKPQIRGTDHGIWRRIKLFPFTITIPDDQQDKNLPKKLADEREGILAWAVRGCLNWQQQGLDEPEAVKAATAEYRGEQDAVGAFLADRCMVDSNCAVKAIDIYAAYRSWCEANGEFCHSQRRFGQALTERSFERYTSNGTWYSGLNLLSEW